MAAAAGNADNQACSVKYWTRDGQVWIKCPRCGTPQELVQSPEDYDIAWEANGSGMVFPDFVCMQEDRSCRYMAAVRVHTK